MTRTQSWILTAAALAVAVLCVWGCFGLNAHLIAAVDRWGNAAPNLQPTLEAISGPRGTLHEVNKAVVKIGDAIVTTQLQERKTAPHVIAAMDSLNGAAQNLAGTASAATGTLTAATETLQEGKRSLTPVPALLEAYTRSGDDLDALLKSKALLGTLANVESTTGNFSLITYDMSRVNHKFTEDFLRPVPWWQQPIRKAGQLIDITAAVARHTP